MKSQLAPIAMATRKKEREQLEELAAFIGRHADGVAVDDIVVGIKLPISHRTLQRRLAALVAQGVIEPDGRTRALRYRLKRSGGAPSADAVAVEPRRPVEGCVPVGL